MGEAQLVVDNSLSLATPYGDTLAACHAIELGASVRKTCTTDGKVPLHHAAMFGRVDICKSLIVNGHADLMATSANGSTPLHLAALNRRMDVCRLLLANGADVTATDKRGRTPEDVATAAGFSLGVLGS